MHAQLVQMYLEQDAAFAIDCVLKPACIQMVKERAGAPSTSQVHALAIWERTAASSSSMQTYHTGNFSVVVCFCSLLPGLIAHALKS